jgi:hypothetical protein
MNFEYLKPEGRVSSNHPNLTGVKLTRDMNPCKEVMLSKDEQLEMNKMIKEWISKPKNFIKDYGISTDTYIKKDTL